jgi:hypothetical protein
VEDVVIALEDELEELTIQFDSLRFRLGRVLVKQLGCKLLHLSQTTFILSSNLVELVSIGEPLQCLFQVVCQKGSFV